ncbi:FAD-dependent oxidoreductase [Mycobacterium sp. CVI_P3]|uniref:FAD-dependent oxidoreductase n=1 Tax=Mycobacterium pinniadriaticum TaxID=2994102 RepID=A0ABT3SBI9_9MYCO|nr:FAD-dependent oxidoreductase [Mycobacterium pinniadriaticum]MCX2930071.1 FAD-dependent oxidoreductase [Mycobacterium pinniadriaticum]MCX2936280.1 FAD-dependent oxidoreductase [Mycobacterium pinniadriaticum]
MASVVVVGAGLSGLTAAYRLTQAGATVVVLEAGARPGGRVETQTCGRYLVDTGPDALTAGYSSYLRLISDIGFQDRLHDTSAVIGLVRDGRVIDIDPGRLLRLPFTPALSTVAKLRMAVGFVKLRKAIAGVDSYDMGSSADLDDPSMTAAEFARRQFGREVADYLIDPLMRLTTGSGADNASTLSVLGALGAWSGALRTVRGGLGSVTDALAGRLDVRYGATVTRVDESATGVSVSYVDGDGGEHDLTADGVVISAMYDRASDIWPALSHASPAFGDKLRNVKLISVSLGYTAPTTTAAYPILVPTVENREALLIFMQHNKSPDRAPVGHSLVTVYTDTTVTDSFLGRSDAQLEAWAAGIIERLCPELAGHRDMAVVTRWPVAGYLAEPGFWQRSKILLGALPTDGPVRVAGDLFGAGSMESATRWGDNAAAALLRQLA